MQRRVLLGACAAVIVVAGVVVLRGITRHEATHVLDQNIDQLLANLPPGYAVRHGATDYNPLTGTLTVHDLAVTREGGTAWTADTLTVSGADGQALRDVFDPAAYPNGHPAWTERRLLIADASAQGVHATIPGPHPADLSARSVSWHRLSGRPFRLPPTPDNQAQPGFGADAALGFALDTGTVRDLALATGGPNTAKWTAAAFDASNYDGGRLGSVALKTVGIDVQAKPGQPPVHITAAGMDIKDADARGPMQAVSQTGRADATAMAAFSYGSSDVTGVAMQVPAGPAISLHDFHAEQGLANAAGTREGHGSLHALTVALGETAVPPAAAPGLAAFGMTALTLDLDVLSRTTAPAHTAEVSEDLTLQGLGVLHLKGSFSGYDPAQATPGAPTAALLATTLDHASIVWDDASLTDRLFKVAAVQAHTTPELIRAKMAMPVVALGVMLPDQPDAADQVTAFLSHPHTLTVTMNPPQKVTVGQVMAAPTMARAHLLGVHVTGK